MLDFYRAGRRNAKTAKRFLSALKQQLSPLQHFSHKSGGALIHDTRQRRGSAPQRFEEPSDTDFARSALPASSSRSARSQTALTGQFVCRVRGRAGHALLVLDQDGAVTCVITDDNNSEHLGTFAVSPNRNWIAYTCYAVRENESGTAAGIASCLG